jgi:hypothetical protein
MGMCLGAAGALLVCVALIITSLFGKGPEERQCARQLLHRSRAPVSPDDVPDHTDQQGALSDPLIDLPFHEVDPAPESVESEASLFFLERDPDVGTGPGTERRADFEPSPPAPAFRALGIRIAGLPARLPRERALPARTTSISGNGSPDDSFRRVQGTNRRGRLCWICGREHGSEIVHETVSDDSFELTLDPR